MNKKFRVRNTKGASNGFLVATIMLVVMLLVFAYPVIRETAKAGDLIPPKYNLPQDEDKREQAIYKALITYLESKELPSDGSTCVSDTFDLLGEQKLTNIFYVLKQENNNYVLVKYAYGKTKQDKPKELEKKKLVLGVQDIRTFTLGATDNVFIPEQFIPIVFFHKNYYKYHSDSPVYEPVPTKPYIKETSSEPFTNIGLTRYYYSHDEPLFYMYKSGEITTLLIEPHHDGYQNDLSNRDHLEQNTPDCLLP